MRLAVLTLLLVTLPLVGGCKFFEDVRELSPEQQWAASAEVYIATTKAITILGNEGVFTVDELLTIKEWKQKARDALGDWKKAILSDNYDGVLVAMKLFDEAMDELIKKRMVGEIE